MVLIVMLNFGKFIYSKKLHPGHIKDGYIEVFIKSSASL